MAHAEIAAEASRINRRKSKETRRRIRIKRYKCEQCDFCGDSNFALSCHSVVHTGVKAFPCTFTGCSYRAGWKSALQKHLVTHVADREKVLVFHCDQCDYRAATNGNLRQHKVVHLNSNSFVCDHPSCNFRTKSIPRLARRKKIKHECQNRQTYSCDLCNYSSKIKWNFSNHIKTHERESIACEYPGCNFKCRLAWNLKVHVRRYHDPSGTYLLCCHVDDCTFKTTDKGAWKKHLEIHNPNRRPSLVCTLCPRSFYGSEALERHVALSHTGEECYRCKFCKFSCKYNNLLQKHMSQAHVSDQERDSERAKIREMYKCSFCNYASIYRHRVIQHERIHTGEKPLACSSCSFRTNDSSTLRKHLRFHGRIGDQTVECSLCAIKFAKRRALTTHMKTVHSICTEMIFRCQYCSYSSKFQCQLRLHIRRKHGIESDGDEHTSDSSSSLELNEGNTRKKYPRGVFDCNCTATKVRDRSLRRTLHNRSQRGNKINQPTGKIIFKCNYCSYSSQLAETMKNHLTEHGSNDKMATTGMPERGNGKDRDETVVVASGTENRNFDSQKAHENRKITRVFACGLCDLLSSTYDAAVLHSVDHKTLIITLERIVVC